MSIFDHKELFYISSSNTPSHDGGASSWKPSLYTREHEVKQGPAFMDPEEAIDTPPNGGFKAWLQACGSFFLMMNCWSAL